jgi:predicted enzyme related to lactoylglutathione lyase
MNTFDNVVYTVSDLATAKAIHTVLLGTEPHTDQPYYVGFNVDGIEISLAPRRDGGDVGAVAHVCVPDIEAALTELKAAGASIADEPRDVGGGTLVAAVRDPDGTTLGLIQRP